MLNSFCTSGNSPTELGISPASILATVRDISKHNHDQLPCGTFVWLAVLTATGHEPLWVRAIGRSSFGLLGRCVATHEEIRFTRTNILEVAGQSL